MGRIGIQNRIGEGGYVFHPIHPFNLPEEAVRYSMKGLSNSDTDRNTLKDLSGRGNSSTLNSFTYSLLSGYGGFTEDFLSWTPYPDSFTEIVSDSKLIISKSPAIGAILGSYRPVKKGDQIRARLKVTGDLVGLQASFYYGNYPTSTPALDTYTLKEGINDIDMIASEDYMLAFRMNNRRDCNVTIEQLPLYPDALCFNGAKFNCSGSDKRVLLKTIIMKCQLNTLEKKAFNGSDYGPSTSEEFCLYTVSDTMAYRKSNPGGLTYINGDLNESKTAKDLQGKLMVVAMTNSQVTKEAPFSINSGFMGSQTGDTILYDFIGYDEALDQDQIKAVIKKYKLLKGVKKL